MRKCGVQDKTVTREQIRAVIRAEREAYREQWRGKRRGWCGWREHRHGLAKKLYWRIYLALLACLVMMALLFMLVMRWTTGGSEAAPRLEVLAEIAARVLPPANAPRLEQEQALEHWHARGGVDLALLAADGSTIALAGAEARAPAQSRSQGSHWLGGHPPAVALKLSDGRWLTVRYDASQGYGVWGLFGVLLLVGMAVGMAAFPVARRMTQRLERLQYSVEALGDGNFSARVPVQGQDEVARLAQSFNRAAERIEALVAAQKSLLANASHELRSPLARIRMAAELQHGDADPEAKRELARNIAELDQLIDEILLASRLDAAYRPEEHFEVVDLTGLAAEECARAEVEFDSEGVLDMQGDARLLRRLIRNLIENARRYGGAQPVEVRLRKGSDGAVLEVADRGCGVSDAERERIFEPFYRARGASEQQGGVGLGLALVRQIAARHKARVECLPREGGGCVFRVSGLA